MFVIRLVIAVSMTAGLTVSLSAQWTNRYPKIEGMSHHVYLEGYELPTLTVGPFDPAPSPDGVHVAVASRGWIWLLDLHNSIATRVTRGSTIDSRPAWSPDGLSLAFVRDDGSDTWIVVRDMESGNETRLNTPAIDLDPAFSSDGVFLYYSSANDGTLDIWRRNLRDNTDSPVVTAGGSQLKPQPLPDGTGVIFLEKRGDDAIRMRHGATGEDRVLHAERLATMSRPALSPDGKLVAFNWPTQDGYELRLLDVNDPVSSVLLTGSLGLPLTPAWSTDGNWVYFVEATGEETFQLKRINARGGRVASVSVGGWDWGEPTGVIRIASNSAVRLGVLDASGHPAIPEGMQSRFDGQNGRVFFYSQGIVEVVVPAGDVTVSAVRGLTTPEHVVRTKVGPGEVVDVEVDPTPIWVPRDHGWVSADHHFHLNYGGPYRLTPDDLVPMMEAENVDVATPLLANLHNRFEDQRFWQGSLSGTLPIVRFGQEVRSHFLGHVGLIGTTDLFWPWIWGPGYQVYGTDDRPNTDALEFARNQGGLSIYVHPLSVPDPFSASGMQRIPVELVVDGVLGAFDLLEVVCLWSNDVGTSELWYRLLNIGVPVAPSGGTDVMNNFYRTMAIGTARVFVRTDSTNSWQGYTTALKNGHSFVTTGPMLEFLVEDAGPGDVVTGSRSARWTLDLHSATAVDSVQLIVNGEIVWGKDGLQDAGTRSYSGRIDLPAGGWIAMRAVGGDTSWPGMSNFSFAHTAPVWIGSVGSTDNAARRAAAAELLQVLDVSRDRLEAGYRGVEIPRLRAKFAEARSRLMELVN